MVASSLAFPARPQTRGRDLGDGTDVIALASAIFPNDRIMLPAGNRYPNEDIAVLASDRDRGDFASIEG